MSKKVLKHVIHLSNSEQQRSLSDCLFDVVVRKVGNISKRFVIFYHVWFRIEYLPAMYLLKFVKPSVEESLKIIHSCSSKNISPTLLIFQTLDSNLTYKSSSFTKFQFTHQRFHYFHTVFSIYNQIKFSSFEFQIGLKQQVSIIGISSVNERTNKTRDSSNHVIVTTAGSCKLAG